MADTGAPPVIPTEFQQYNSYVIDPQWQRKFSIIWPSVLGLFILLSIPHLVRSIQNGRAYSTLLGISEDISGSKDYLIASASDSRTQGLKGIKQPSILIRKVEIVLEKVGSWFYWSVPGIGLNAGQLLIIAGYIVTVILCMALEAPLISNANRPGFIAIAQLPVIFLFATKNSIVSLLLGPGNGYEKLNFIHRWSGRAMFICSLLHGALWIRNHLEYNEPILGEQKETSGIAAFGVLCVIVLTSLKPIRHYFYEVFYFVHTIAYVAFFVTICYHTLYAAPWIFPSLAFYGLDLLLRMLRHQIKDAVLVPVGNQMTLIHVPYATSGWLAGQHVRLRVFFSGRIFESHPLTIFSAPPDVSCITSMTQGISFGVRVNGDWSRALNRYALEAVDFEQKNGSGGSEVVYTASTRSEDGEKKEMSPRDGSSAGNSMSASLPEVPVQVMLDGPYGGCSVDLGNYESAFLIAGGSGVTFTLGVLDDIVGRCVRLGRRNGERTRRVEFAWCVKSFGAIEWFKSALMDIATMAALSLATETPLEVHMSIFVTCLCNPDAVPLIPNCDFVVLRPVVHKLLADFMSPSSPAVLRENRNNNIEKSSSVTPSQSDDIDVLQADEPNLELGPKQAFSGRPHRDGGGLAVCASGPESLTRETANAVARLQIFGFGRRDVGGVGLHTEVFSL